VMDGLRYGTGSSVTIGHIMHFVHSMRPKNQECSLTVSAVLPAPYKQMVHDSGAPCRLQSPMLALVANALSGSRQRHNTSAEK